METIDASQLTHFFSALGVPAILIGFAVFAASRHLSHIACVLGGAVGMHFGFIAFWHQMVAMNGNATPVIGAVTVGEFTRPSLQLAASCAHVWLGFANLCPVAHDQIGAALRWMIGGTA